MAVLLPNAIGAMKENNMGVRETKDICVLVTYYFVGAIITLSM